MQQEDWEQPHARSLALRLNGADSALLIVLNAHFEPVEFSLPDPENSGWRMLIDTAAGVASVKSIRQIEEAELTAPERALLLLESWND